MFLLAPPRFVGSVARCDDTNASFTPRRFAFSVTPSLPPARPVHLTPCHPPSHLPDRSISQGGRGGGSRPQTLPRALKTSHFVGGLTLPRGAQSVHFRGRPHPPVSPPGGWQEEGGRTDVTSPLHRSGRAQARQKSCRSSSPPPLAQRGPSTRSMGPAPSPLLARTPRARPRANAPRRWSTRKTPKGLPAMRMFKR